MRTSKKGGRGGSWGAQAAVESGTPALASPVRRYEASSSERSVTGQLVRGLGWFLLVVLVIGAGIAGGAYLYDQHTLQELRIGGQQGVQVGKHLHPIKSVNSPAIALVAG